jgi:hypothetical protein
MKAACESWPYRRSNVSGVSSSSAGKSKKESVIETVIAMKIWQCENMASVAKS